MKIIHIDFNITPYIQLAPSCVTIGAFDGIHKAHRALMEKTRMYSKEHNLKSGVISFSPNPIEVIKNTLEIPLLSDSSKEQMIALLGFDYYFIIHFTKDIMNLEPSLFIQKLLFEQNVKHIIVGYDFTFGYKGQGKANDIEMYANHLITVDIMDEIPSSVPSNEEAHLQKISSTNIRMYLQTGNITLANRDLGYDYFINGIVSKGNQVGRNIDYPTMNILCDQVNLLKPGVYITTVTLDNEQYPAMTNIGHNSKFNYKEELTMETYILGFHKNVYNQMIHVSFKKYLRDEIEFNDLEKLRVQLEVDECNVRDYFK